MNSHSPGRADHDDGVATVWAAAVLVVLAGALTVGLALGAAVTARHRAAAAADLAALAAAGQAVFGTAVACDRAAAVAAGTGATLTGCRLDGWDALVEVEVPVRVTLLGPSAAAARARAGPTEAASAPAQLPEHQVEHGDGAGLVEREVAVAALGRLDTRRTTRRAAAPRDDRPGGGQPPGQHLVTALGEPGPAGRGTVRWRSGSRSTGSSGWSRSG